MADVDVSRPDSGPRTASRRELERIAYGPGTGEEQRRLAQEELARREAATAAVADRGLPVTGTAGPVETALTAAGFPSEADPDEQQPSRPPESRRRRVLRRAALAGGAILGVLAAALIVPATLEPSSLDVFQQAQTDRDRDAPLEVANAVAAGASASGQPGAGAALFASVRRLDGPDVSAFAFTDGDVVCLMVESRIECGPGVEFRHDGLVLEIDDAGAGGRRVTWGPKGRLAMERDDVILDPSGDSRSLLMRQCMAGHGIDASATSRGDVLAGPGVDSRTLEFAMARLDCAIRHPLDGG